MTVGYHADRFDDMTTGVRARRNCPSVGEAMTPAELTSDELRNREHRPSGDHGSAVVAPCTGHEDAPPVLRQEWVGTA